MKITDFKYGDMVKRKNKESIITLKQHQFEINDVVVLLEDLLADDWEFYKTPYELMQEKVKKCVISHEVVWEGDSRWRYVGSNNYKLGVSLDTIVKDVWDKAIASTKA